MKFNYDKKESSNNYYILTYLRINNLDYIFKPKFISIWVGCIFLEFQCEH